MPNNVYNLLLNPRILTKYSRILYLAFIYYIYCLKIATNHTQNVAIYCEISVKNKVLNNQFCQLFQEKNQKKKYQISINIFKNTDS